MIKVIVTGPPKNGYFPYRIDWWFQGRPQLVGLSPAPMLDACRQLQQMGLMDSTVVSLFDHADDDFYYYRTTVGEGAQKWRRYMGQYREFPGGPLKDTPEPPAPVPVSPAEGRATMTDEGIRGTPDMNTMPDLGDVTDAPTTTPAEEPQEHHTRREHQAGKGRAHAEPDKPEPQHRKQKRAKSGARRGSR